MSIAAERERARQFVQRFGRDVVSWQGLESGCRYWFTDDACVAYVDTGRAWVAAGSPWCDATRLSTVAHEFASAARRSGKRACFFGVDAPQALPGLAATLLGEQPLFDPGGWQDTLARQRGLREQLRRARKKGVRVRRVDAGDLAAGEPLRRAVEAIATAWLRSRHLEPMAFLVSVEPFTFADAHRYYVAERAGAVVAFTSLVPVPALGGWLVEDSFRDDGTPNGTTELLLDAAMRDAVGGAFVSLGLTPLSGRVPGLLRLVAALTSPLYDFGTLRAFRQRLHPDRWQSVWLVHAHGRRWWAISDALRAFSRGSLLTFALRSLLLRPSGLPWLLALPLVPWTLALAVLAGVDDRTMTGFGPAALWAWVAWDATLAWLLFRVARRPRRRTLWWLSAAAGVDAAVSLVHVVHVGLGVDRAAQVIRLAGTLAPIVGALALAWAASRAPSPP